MEGRKETPGRVTGAKNPRQSVDQVGLEVLRMAQKPPDPLGFLGG